MDGFECSPYNFPPRDVSLKLLPAVKARLDGVVDTDPGLIIGNSSSDPSLRGFFVVPKLSAQTEVLSASRFVRTTLDPRAIHLEVVTRNTDGLNELVWLNDVTAAGATFSAQPSELTLTFTPNSIVHGKPMSNIAFIFWR